MVFNTLRTSRIRVGAAFGLVIGAAWLLGSIALADNAVVQPLSGGTRTAGVDDVTLGSLTYSHSSQANTDSMVLTVYDSSGTGEGWNVTVQSSDFGYSGLYGGTAIDASSFAITSAGTPSATAGQTVDGTNGPKVPSSNATGSLDVARKVLHADAGYGQGTYNQALDIELLVPGMARAGDYTSSLTVTISAGP